MNKIIPPFNRETAKAKVQAAENAWNSKNPENVSMAYSIDSEWRNRDKFFKGREAIAEFLSGKWEKELHYKLKKHLWSFTENRISVRFEYEWQNAESLEWYRTHGNEHWEFNEDGLMRVRDMSANDVKIKHSERRL